MWCSSLHWMEANYMLPRPSSTLHSYMVMSASVCFLSVMSDCFFVGFATWLFWSWVYIPLFSLLLVFLFAFFSLFLSLFFVLVLQLLPFGYRWSTMQFSVPFLDTNLTPSSPPIILFRSLHRRKLQWPNWPHLLVQFCMDFCSLRCLSIYILSVRFLFYFWFFCSFVLSSYIKPTCRHWPLCSFRSHFCLCWSVIFLIFPPQFFYLVVLVWFCYGFLLCSFVWTYPLQLPLFLPLLLFSLLTFSPSSSFLFACLNSHLLFFLIFVCFILVFSISFAAAFIPSTFAVFVVRERETKAKHQQVVSGVSLSAYWVSSWLWDYCSFLIPMALSLILIQVSLRMRGRTSTVLVKNFLFCFLFFRQSFSLLHFHSHPFPCCWKFRWPLILIQIGTLIDSHSVWHFHWFSFNLALSLILIQFGTFIDSRSV